MYDTHSDLDYTLDYQLNDKSTFKATIRPVTLMGMAPVLGDQMVK